jgi:hypothetical protein
MPEFYVGVFSLAFGQQQPLFDSQLLYATGVIASVVDELLNSRYSFPGFPLLRFVRSSGLEWTAIAKTRAFLL